MNASSELALKAVLVILGLIGLGAVSINMGSKKDEEKTNMTIQATVTARSYCSSYSVIVPTLDYQNINIKTMQDKNLLPKNSVVSGTGSTSTMAMPFDKRILMSIEDPNSGSATLKGRSYQVKLDASGSDIGNLQNFEDSLNTHLSNLGATMSGYTSTGADGVISATFE